MTTNVMTAGNGTDLPSVQGGNDGIQTITVGAHGSQVSFTISSAGITFPDGSVLLHATKAATQSTVASPTFPNSTANYTMQGLAGTITPTSTGRILVTIAGTIAGASAATAGIGVLFQISHGTSTAPTTNGVLAGTQDGVIQQNEIAVASTVADVFTPFSATALITGLTLNTAYWLDLAAKSVGTANDMGFKNVVITAVEV